MRAAVLGLAIVILRQGGAVSVLPEGRVDLSWTTAVGMTYVVDPHLRLQTMDGFGACERNSVELTDPLADLFFDQTTGIGLSLLRTCMWPEGQGSDFPANATKAVARGAKVWMASWTAPAAMKDNNSEVNGGHLLVGAYGDWADTLCAFHAYLHSASGVDLYGLSPQGEPDFSSTTHSMLFTDAELVAFLKVLWPKMQLLSPVPRLILPEVATYANLAGYISAVLADPVTAPMLDIVAWHQYGGNNTSPIAGYPNWMTEFSYFDAFDPSMAQALIMAADIHAALTIGNVSAWHYWELTGAQSDNEGLIGHDGGTETTKRVYALGNWSKFVRPGHVRVSVVGTVGGVSVTAFLDPARSACVIVAVNANGSGQAVSLGVKHLHASAVTPWLTDATHDLAAQSTVPVSNGQFATTLAASSVTTFVSVP